MNDNCTILVSSCDAYADVWDLFFKALKVQWPEREYPIVLNTESKKYDFEDLQIKTFQFYKPTEVVPWAKRLKRTLKEIKSDFVILMLEDFVLTDKVDVDRLNECFSAMKNNEDISQICFWPNPFNNIDDGFLDGFELREKKGEYKFNCQAGIWRRTHLIQYLRDFEDPWQWELVGNRRSWRVNYRFYSQKKNEPKIFEYPRGGVVWRGLWTLETAEIIKKYDIELDLNDRGMLDPKDEYRSAGAYSLRANFPKGIITVDFWIDIKKRILRKVNYLRSVL